MKKGINGRLVSGILAALMCTVSIQLPAANAAKTITENETGTEDGYAYELWKDTGNTSMTLTGGGTFSCEWSNINNCLFRKGQKFDCTQTYEELGNISIDYGVDYQPNGNSYLCVYGWTKDPLIEYYIVETWGSWRPPGADSAIGQVSVDGGTYDIYKTERVNQPSIIGDTTFYQYWSVRTDKPSAVNNKIEGTISVSEHFKAWESFGLTMGKMYEVALNVEGYQSSGKANVYKNDLTIGGEGGGSTIVTPSTPSKEPDENGYYFNDIFESGSGNWSVRGGTSLTNDSKNYYSGSKSLKVSGREDTWQGTAISLDSEAFAAGNSYSFGTAVLQKSGSAQEVRLTLQYKGSDGDTHYSTVASVTAESGEWTDLSNTSYTIPTGATDLLLYVEMPDNTDDFWIDDAFGAVKGKASAVTTGGGTVEGKETVTTAVTATTTTTTTTAAATTTTATTATTTAPVSDTGKVTVWGDANNDGSANISDAVLILQTIANPDGYELSGQGRINADVYDNGDGITAMDALSIQKFEAGLLTKLPESYLNGNDNNSTTDTIYLTGSFENSTDDWEKRDSVTFSLDSANYYSGNSSLKVSGREDTWQGAAYALDSDTFTSGKSYSFSAAVMQGSGDSEEMKITLQYTDADGETRYDTVASADTNSGEWTKLENTAYTIPEGTSELLLYIETSKSLTDIYIDDVQAAAEGTKSSVVTGKGTVALPPVSDENKESSDVDISWIDTSKPMVAICFDDGAKSADPSSSSMRIINAIADSGFHSTFFYVGNWINANNQEEVKYAFEKGMEIANHSTSHPDLTTLSADEIRSEFETTNDKLASIIGTEPSRMMRLPYLACNSTVQSALDDVALISCSVDTGDWDGASTQDIISKVTAAMNDGSLDNAIVLCHETYDTTAEAMEYLAPYLKENGWQIVTVSELFAANGKKLNGGTVYSKCS